VNSAIYEGTIEHRRLGPVRHEFSYPVWMAYLDLAELPEALDRHPLWSARRPAPLRVRRRDYLERPELPLGEEVRRLVRERTGSDARGPVRLLTTPRFLGAGFNPVSFMYVFSDDGGDLEALVAEVTNTPWGDRHRYVARAADGTVDATLDKRMHVSPFMPMEQTYRLRAGRPGERLRVTITSQEGGTTAFAASLDLRHRPLDRATLTRMAVARPPQSPATLARIYLNAVRLKLKGATYHRRPGRFPAHSGG
jgi:uncharacterized protein